MLLLWGVRVEGGQWVLDDAVFFDDFTLKEVALNDGFNHLWHGVAIPDPIGIDEENWPLGTDAKTVGFGAKHAIGAEFGGTV